MLKKNSPLSWQESLSWYVTTVCFFIGGACYFIFKDLKLQFAYHGFNPVAWLNKLRAPEQYLADFPSGIEHYSKSLVMNFYFLLESFLSPFAAIQVFIFLEIFLLAIAIYIVGRSMKVEKLTFIIFTAIVILFSFARNINVANWGQPFYVGQFYTITDAFRLLAWSFLLTGAYGASVAFGVFSFMSHMTMGVIGFIFNFVSLSSRLISKQRVFYSLATGGAFCLYAWWSLSASPQEVVPASEWWQYTGLLNYHWYPISFGLFTDLITYKWGQFLGFMLLLLVSMQSLETKLKTIFYKLIVVTLALCSFGILNSYCQWSVTLTKLALHRSNDLLVLLGLFVIVPFLLRQVLYSKNIFLNFLSLVILYNFFNSATPYSWGLIFPWALFTLYEQNKTQKISLRSLEIKALFVWGVSFIISIGVAWKYLPIRDHFIVFGSLWALYPWAGILLVKLGFNKYYKPLCFLLLTYIMASGVWSFGQTVRLSDERRLKYSDYYQTQVWAKSQTSQGSLFMPPPDVSYGWRDFSERPSFGGAREWLLTSWAYDSSLEKFTEGVKRAQDLGISLEKYKGGSVRFEGQDLIKEARTLYSSHRLSWFCMMADKYKIQYFVLPSQKVFKKEITWAYENKSYKVLSAQLCSR